MKENVLDLGNQEESDEKHLGTEKDTLEEDSREKSQEKEDSGH